MGIIWYLQSVASGSLRKGNNADQTDPNLAEVACLMRDKTNQDLVVTMNGHSIRHATELNPGQSRRLHFASKVLIKWLADAPAPAEGEESGELTAAEATPGTTPSTPDEEWIPAETAPLPPKPEAAQPPAAAQTPPVKPISTQLADVVSGFLNPASSAPKAPEPKSIARQIDEVLQGMIIGTPFEQRGLSLNDAPDHGVMVALDGKEYPGVKDVPDEEVRNLIRSAVVEWEKASKPNPH
jgi:hypothetical protein